MPTSQAKKRLLFFGHLPPPSSGEGNILQSFFDSLPESRYKLRLLDAGDRHAAQSPARISLYNVIRTLKHLWRMFWVCLVWRPHYVHIFLTAGPAVFKFGLLGLIAQLLGARFVANHQSGLIVAQYDRYGKSMQALMRRMLRLPDAWIATSQMWADWLTNHGVPAERIAIIPNAVKTELMSAFEDFERLARDPAQPVRLLSIGAVGQRKGTDLFAEVCARLFNAGVPFHVLIAGDEEHPGEMAAMQALFASRLPADAYTFAGHLEGNELVKVLKEADIFLFPTRGDNYPVALAEAMMAGLAIVATRTGAIPEMIEGSRTGLLANSEDVEGLAQATLRLAEDPGLALRLGRAARAVAGERNNPAQVAARLDRLLQSMNSRG